MGLFRDIIQKEISNDKMKLEATTFKEKKEKKEQTKLINLSPRTKKVEEHKMNRDKSVENFVKYSWSWTI